MTPIFSERSAVRLKVKSVGTSAPRCRLTARCCVVRAALNRSGRGPCVSHDRAVPVAVIKAVASWVGIVPKSNTSAGRAGPESSRSRAARPPRRLGQATLHQEPVDVEFHRSGKGSAFDRMVQACWARMAATSSGRDDPLWHAGHQVMPGATTGSCWTRVSRARISRSPSPAESPLIGIGGAADDLGVGTRHAGVVGRGEQLPRSAPVNAWSALSYCE